MNVNEILNKALSLLGITDVTVVSGSTDARLAKLVNALGVAYLQLVTEYAPLEKEESVTTLQTQLASAQLDASAAGQARARELRDKLKTAQDSLEDFTLEHAIDVITKNLDNQYDEYEKYIGKKLDEIENAINGLKDNGGTSGGFKIDTTFISELSSRVTRDIAGKARVSSLPSGGGSRLELMTYRLYHDGGIVGDTPLKTTEEYAKLLKGEFVATPAQITRFMTQTLPALRGQNWSDGAVFNAPLVSLSCGNVDKDTYPSVKNLVNQAVQEIKHIFDGGMTRTGFKQTIDKF